MDERDIQSLHQMHDALIQRGFERLWTSECAIYRGLLDPTGLKVPVRIDVSSIDFVRPPPIYVEDSYHITGRRLPHLLGESRSFCYYATGAVVLDRYNPGGTILQCLEQADSVMRKAVRGQADTDFADEFHSYWSSFFLLVDLPSDFTGKTRVRYLDLDHGADPTPVICLDDSWLIDVHRSTGKALPEGDECVVVSTDKALSLNPNEEWPPANLSDFNRWLGWMDPKFVGMLERGFASGKSLTRYVAIRAANGTYVFSASLPTVLQKEEFQKSRQSNLPVVLNRLSKKVPVTRTSGVPADTDYIFSRNMGNMNNLSGKRILLIGVGTIGGFLAHQLAQSGAGSGGGQLVLLDTDVLRTANIGRHLLGIPFINQNKAESCSEFLKQQLPMLDVGFRTHDALDLPLGENLPYDLIIDATGEEALSLALNERAVRSRGAWPPILFGYLMGNGAMAQALLTGNRDYACLKCLKPQLSGEPRFRSLRPDIEVVKVANMQCADPLHIPYPVTRSVVAAALICEMALAWAGEAVGHRFRSHLFDQERAYLVKDGNPTPSRDCPACRAT
ncbi:ThiF family adenylyltransferase [Rhizobium leguminosarum]|uniref:ThiF family adenylyltransferase n=1 Tax=Rhizobium leguminosarum TaxID=384 RepID=UPI003F9878EA